MVNIFIYRYPFNITINIFRKRIIQSQENEKFLLNIFDFNIFENRLYIVSTLVIIFCYFLVQNFNYREIFLIGLVPYILKNEKVYKRGFLNNLYYIIVIKFLFSTILIYLTMNKVNVDLNYFMNLAKHILDFYVVSILSIILILNLKIYLKNISIRKYLSTTKCLIFFI